MTMNLIRHGTKRAGFKDWPTYDNKPGKEEPEIARYAIPDPALVEEPPSRTDNTGKTVAGAKIAEKIRDLRLRRNITGSTAIPRLRHKTHPMQIGAAQEVDFEEEVAKYKQEIRRDIQQLKKQEYVPPKWVQEQIGTTNANQSPTPASSSWEGPITDSQAVRISDYLLTEEEEREFFSNEENTHGPEQGPSWEQIWFADHDANWDPADLRGYGPQAYEIYLENG